MAFRLVGERRHPERDDFAAQLPSLHDPYRRFAAALTDSRRTAQGHRGSLLLRCRETRIPFLTPVVRRFPNLHLSHSTASRNLAYINNLLSAFVTHEGAGNSVLNCEIVGFQAS